MDGVKLQLHALCRGSSPIHEFAGARDRAAMYAISTAGTAAGTSDELNHTYKIGWFADEQSSWFYIDEIDHDGRAFYIGMWDVHDPGVYSETLHRMYNDLALRGMVGR